MAAPWSDEQNQQLTELVVRLRFNFAKISKELNREEEAVRTHWTELYLSKKQATAAPKPPPGKKPSEKPPLQENLPPASKRMECPSMSFEQPESAVLDTTNVDFTQQTSRSITGEVIHPSGFNIFKHSLKEVFTEIFDRMQTYLPTMDFSPTPDPPEDTEPVSYKITFKSGQPTIESKRGAKGKWQPTAPSVPIPNYDDINPIPEGDRPVRKSVEQVPLLVDSDEVMFRAVDTPLVDLTAEYQKTTQQLAQLFNLTEAEVTTLKDKKAPTRVDTIKGRVRVESKDSDYESDEEEAFLREMRLAKKRDNPQPLRTEVVVPVEGVEKPADKSESEDEEPDNPSILSVPEPYSVVRQRESEQRAEAFRLLRGMEVRDREERAAEERREQERRDREEMDRKLRQEELENARLQAKREAKLQARLLEELKRKELLLKAEAEVKKQLEEEQRRKTEERIKAAGFSFFDPVTSFEPAIPGLPESTRVKIIGIEEKPYVWPLVIHFLGHSAVFGKADTTDEVSFRLVGLTRSVMGGQVKDLSFAPGADPVTIWFLAFDLDSSSIGFNSYLEGFPLAYVIPGGVPGKTFLKEIVLEQETVSDRHMIVPVETVFQAAPSFYPRNECGIQEYEYAFAVVKPHSSPFSSLSMLRYLTDLLSCKALDVIGCRLLYPSPSARLTYEERFGKSLSSLQSPFLVLCIYGYCAIDQLHDLLGAETPDLARRTDPESLRAKFGETKETNCVYTAKLKQRVYKELCLWFGGRADVSTPPLTVLECPPLEVLSFALSPCISYLSLLPLLDETLQLGYTINRISRLSRGSTEYCGFQPCSRTVLKTVLSNAYGWLITVTKPAAVRHFPQLLSLFALPEGTVRPLTEEETAFLEDATSQYGDLELFASVGHIIVTPEAFVPTANAFPAVRIAEKIAEMSEILSLKVVTGELPAEIDSDYSETVQMTVVRPQGGMEGKLRPWLETGPVWLVSYLPETQEAGKSLLSGLRKEVPNSGFSQFTKPSYLLAPRCGPLLAPSARLLFDPLHPFTSLVNLPPAVELPNLDQGLSTICVVKPEKGQTVFRQVLKFAWRHGFDVSRVHMQRLTEGLADMLFEHQREGMEDDLNYDLFKSILLAGPCITLHLTRRNAIKKLKESVGHPNPQRAELNSLRGSYGKSPEDNKLHCSLSFSHAQVEALRLFSGDEFVRSDVTSEDEEVAVCVLALKGVEEREVVGSVFEEMRGMQVTLLDLRISVLPESHLESFLFHFPSDLPFATLLHTSKSLSFAVRGLSPIYRLQTLFRTLKIETNARCPSNSEEVQKFAEIFLPPYPY